MQKSLRWVGLDGLYLRCARAFRATTYFEFDFFAVFKFGVAVALNFGVVNKEIFVAIFRLDESVAFFGVEPFYCSCAHILIFLYCVILQNPPLAGSASRVLSDKMPSVAINL